jgi:predicted transcriptional regulator of viral defense system
VKAEDHVEEAIATGLGRSDMLVVHAKMLRLELLKVKADLEGELGTWVVDCGTAAARSASRRASGRTGSLHRTGSRASDSTVVISVRSPVRTTLRRGGVPRTWMGLSVFYLAKKARMRATISFFSRWDVTYLAYLASWGTMNPMPTQIQEAAGAIAGAGKEFFTPDDLATLLNIPKQRAYELAARMAKANLARRVKRGLYALLPATDWSSTSRYSVNWFETAAQIMSSRPYFLAYYSAMQIHQMIQHPLRTVFVASTSRQRSVKVGPVRFRFITLIRRRFFGYGPYPIREGWRIETAHLERTFIDCVDRPDLCGGIEEVFGGFRRRHKELEPDRLLTYVLKFNQPAVARRLGFLLESVGYPNVSVLWDLQELVSRHGEYVPLVPGQEQGGERNRRWRLVLPSDIRKLIESPIT